jgi:hypothetical protein
VRFEAQVRIPVWLCSSDSELFRNRFSVNEKDEASLMDRFHQDSLDAFIPRFAGVWRFFYFQASRWSRNCKIVPGKFSAEHNGKISIMKKVRLFLLAVLMAASSAQAGTLVENFATDPLQNGWQIFGDASLFQWDSTNQVLDVTWDSSQPNSYYYHPLGTVLTVDNSFSIEFDLQLSNAVATGENGYQLGLGLFNFSDATNADFSRPLGVTPNLFEYDYYPDVGYGPTISGTLSDMNESAINWYYFDYIDDILPMDNGVAYHVILTHDAGSTNLSGEVLSDGQIYSSLPNVFDYYLANFQIDTVAISSYSDAGDTYGDTIFAQGTVANLVVTWMPPPIQNLTGAFSNGVWQVQFCSQSNWLYALQRSGDLQSWTNVSPAAPGNGTNLFLLDTNPPVNQAFYRVSASQP